MVCKSELKDRQKILLLSFQMDDSVRFKMSHHQCQICQVYIPRREYIGMLKFVLLDFSNFFGAAGFLVKEQNISIRYKRYNKK